MSAITLEAIEAKQIELSQLIAKFKEQPKPTVTYIEIEGTTIALQPGERYAGMVLDSDGDIVSHLVVMAQRTDKKLTWQAAMDWAESIGGSLPSRQELSLIFANCKPHLEAAWHWSHETHEDNASYAWYCYFGDGYINYYLKSFEGSAVAVRSV